MSMLISNPLLSFAVAYFVALCVFGILSASELQARQNIRSCFFEQALKEHGIRVMTIFPSVVDTALAR